MNNAHQVNASDDSINPIVVITVQGGLVADVNATAPVTVIVEDWDCPPDKPLVIHFEAAPLTAEQVQRINATTTQPEKGEDQ